MITLLGVGHVFDIGPRIRDEILTRKPALVCLELDEGRFRALQNRELRKRGLTLYNFVSLFQQRIAQRYGAHVGEEMLAAWEAASELGVPISLIDIDSMITWRRLRASMTPFEALKLLVSTLGAVFIRKERIERELDRYQADSTGFMRAFGKSYPSIKRVLVDERNEHMASRLRELHRRYGDVIALVGDGHVEGLRTLLSDEPVEVVRLWDLRGVESQSEAFTTMAP
ncbi:MAG: TraB/GumN family protein [Candidatus Thermoplasmatota archaeon]|nr:TraB/GumN family protein [Candidatus Thermoplasmatota archaeon]